MFSLISQHLLTQAGLFVLVMPLIAWRFSEFLLPDIASNCPFFLYFCLSLLRIAHFFIAWRCSELPTFPIFELALPLLPLLRSCRQKIGQTRGGKHSTTGWNMDFIQLSRSIWWTFAARQNQMQGDLLIAVDHNPIVKVCILPPVLLCISFANSQLVMCTMSEKLCLKEKVGRFSRY